MISHTHMHESRYSSKRVIAHTYLIDVTCPIYMTWCFHVCTHSYVGHDSFAHVAWHDSFICVTWLFHICDMTHLRVWIMSRHAPSRSLHDDGMCVMSCVPWLIHMCDITGLMKKLIHMCDMTWLVHMCDMTHAYVRHDSCICAGDVTSHMQPKPYMWHDSCMCATWLMHMCDMTHTYVRHDSCICAGDITSCIQPKPYMWHDWFECEK